MLVTNELLAYLRAVRIEADKPDTNVEWFQVCPECGTVPQIHESGHLMMSTTDTDGGPGFDAVIVACEGYWVVNPYRVGIDKPNWSDIDGERPHI